MSINGNAQYHLEKRSYRYLFNFDTCNVCTACIIICIREKVERGREVGKVIVKEPSGGGGRAASTGLQASLPLKIMIGNFSSFFVFWSVCVCVCV